MNRRPRRRIPAIVVAILVLAWLSGPDGAACGDVFFLRHGGRLDGQWLNPDATPPAAYLVRTAAGGQMLLARESVDRVVRTTPAEDEYARRAHACPDTVDGHWQLAQWCGGQRLSKQRRAELHRILQLNPDHEPARRALGYRRVGDKWMTRQEQMAARGLKPYHGRYRTAQEIALREESRRRQQVEKEWYKKLKRWRGWLAGGKPRRIEAARAAILAIGDPAAGPALIESVQRETNSGIRLFLIDTLARVAVPPGGRDPVDTRALTALVNEALYDADPEIRIAALDHLVDLRRPEVTALFVRALKSKDRGEINRAAAALKALGDPAAIPPLIDALVTVHKVKIGSGNPGQTTASFSPGGGGGVGFGSGGPRFVKVTAANPEVLGALVALSGENFEYREKDWTAWYASRRRSGTIDARRD